MKSIVHADYPQRWPQLVPLLDSNMKAGAAHPQRLYGALYTLRILARKYEWVPSLVLLSVRLAFVFLVTFGMSPILGQDHFLPL